MNRIVRFFQNLLFPYDKCPVCEEFTDGLCASCKKKLVFLKEEGLLEKKKGMSILEYNEEGKALLMAYKIQGSFYAGEDMVNLLLYAHRDFIGSFQLITFAPSSFRSTQNLGFDHGAFMAERLSKETGVPWKALFRPSKTEQKKLDMESRKENANHIKLRHDPLAHLKGKRVLIVDDVFTTGSTVGKCVKLLEDQGIQPYYITVFKLM